MTLHSTNELRAINRAAVLAEIARAGSISRAEIAENTKLTIAAISRITRELIDAGVVFEADSEVKPEGAGRRTRLLALAADAATLVVMVISANRRAIGLANCRGEIISSMELPDLNLSKPQESIDTFCQAAVSLMTAKTTDREKILGVSVVVAVNTNPADNDRISSQILGWENVPLKSSIESALKLPVHIEARSVALLQSELWNRSETQHNSIVLVNNGWHLGSSVYANNHLLQTKSGRLGQIAHLPLSGSKEQCYCGQIGCLDAVASGAAIVNQIEKAGLLTFDSSLPLNQKLSSALTAASDNRAVAAIFKRAGEKLGEGLTSVIALFSPEQIFIAGNTCRQSEYFKGVQSRLRTTLEFHTTTELVACTVTSIDAAVISGLKAFLHTHSFNLHRFAGKHRLA